jgi:hypothetical protein
LLDISRRAFLTEQEADYYRQVVYRAAESQYRSAKVPAV